MHNQCMFEVRVEWEVRPNTTRECTINPRDIPPQMPAVTVNYWPACVHVNVGAGTRACVGGGFDSITFCRCSLAFLSWALFLQTGREATAAAPVAVSSLAAIL